MILTLFFLAIFFIIFGIISLYRKKYLIAVMFILLGILSFTVGAVAVYLYPHIMPF